jgi:Glycosyltransferase family 87
VIASAQREICAQSCMPFIDRLATRLVGWLTYRRLTAQAIMLGFLFWTAAAVDFSTPGVMDRAGNVKFQDFLQFYVGAMLVQHGQTDQLFDWQVARDLMHQIAPQWKYALPMVYGPQMALGFSPFSRLSFLTAATLWVMLASGIYFVCCYMTWRVCPQLSGYRRLFWLLALAYPPFFEFVIRGQISALVVACFTVAYFAWRERRPWIAGIALGCLVFKPQFLVAIPIVFLLARAWTEFFATLFSAGAQLGLCWLRFGTNVMRQYVTTLAHLPKLIAATETDKAHALMHSLRSFWSLLISSRDLALALYLISALAVFGLTIRSWNSAGPLSLRFTALVVCATLVNPHLFVYDLLALAPALILLADWILEKVNSTSDAPRDKLACAAYGAYLLPLLGPVTLVTHFQLSVIAIVGLLWEISKTLRAAPAADNLQMAHM